MARPMHFDIQRRVATSSIRVAVFASDPLQRVALDRCLRDHDFDVMNILDVEQLIERISAGRIDVILAVESRLTPSLRARIDRARHPHGPTPVIYIEVEEILCFEDFPTVDVLVSAIENVVDDQWFKVASRSAEPTTHF